ncbi:hypothetical protein [Paremcibacter congregatus]|uniref:Uncharacterized protein n=1 Tax=Paremcibacter congregatus TaxID=2043170 RepID=A0A2G4YX13_9PROT|nr:hypothetical protein [Paremcibacter congregatus]PHZ85976.1 hypothetical protein CRD36_04705 [Paremcibacter congregatus]QDE26942.1 hypothetical protein FIV45_06480 [Paremcibacter congregatus]
MWYRLIALFLGGAFIVLSGCASINGYPKSDIDEIQQQPASSFILSESERHAATTEEKRNAVVNAKLAYIDSAFIDFEQTIYREGMIADIGTEWLLLGLAGATTIAGGARTKEVLGATSMFILGSKAAFDKKVLMDQATAAIVTKMRAGRATVMVDILKGLNQEVGLYSIEAAAVDLARYYYAGTVPGALASITETAGQEVAMANEQAKGIFRDKFQADKAGDCLTEYWKPGGVIEEAHQAEIKKWLSASPYNKVPFGLFMFGSKNAKARVEAVSALIEKGEISACDL